MTNAPALAHETEARQPIGFSVSTTIADPFNPTLKLCLAVKKMKSFYEVNLFSVGKNPEGSYGDLYGAVGANLEKMRFCLGRVGLRAFAEYSGSEAHALEVGGTDTGKLVQALKHSGVIDHAAAIELTKHLSPREIA